MPLYRQEPTILDRLTLFKPSLSAGLGTVLAVTPVSDTPTRPTEAEVLEELAQHVRTLAGPQAVPRTEQVSAVVAMLAEGRRTLLVARTGFGKSAVYFSATKMLRDRGWGPTIVISPLLALMRDQVAAASTLGLRAVTINSSNIDSWSLIEEQINNNEIDLLLIAPERLANAGFRHRVFETLLSQPFALVCDEAHCISDWGHDFRPDYRRLRQLLQDLPPWTPVLATTATANQRVTDDVAKQLGEDTLVLRTSLDRESLRLSVVDLATDAHRLAWLSQNMGALEGSGIIYCLTVGQAEATAAWLNSQGHEVAAYTGAVDADQRLLLEDALRANEIKALVATSALGMGFDKGDLAFCVHLGLPPSPVAYYQQIGRAGRNLDMAEVIALPRPTEDAAIWRWFESVSLPSEEICQSVLDQLDRTEPTSIARMETSVNLGRSRLGTLMNILEVDVAIDRVRGGWVLRQGDTPWSYDHALADSLRTLRKQESDQMRDWAELDSCRLRYLREALDDAEADNCGRCDCCGTQRWQSDPDPLLVAKANTFLQDGDIEIAPRKQWPTGLGEPKGRIRAERQADVGRALARFGDGGWNPIVESLIRPQQAVPVPSDPADPISPEMMEAIAGILKRWDWASRPGWICPVPSRRNGPFINALCQEIGRVGKLPVHQALLEREEQPDHLLSGADPSRTYQSEQANSAHQLSNVWDRFYIDDSALPPAELLEGSVLLVDDEVDSRWTMTTAAWLLGEHVSGAVLPFALRTR